MSQGLLALRPEHGRKGAALGLADAYHGRKDASVGAHATRGSETESGAVTQCALFGELDGDIVVTRLDGDAKIARRVVGILGWYLRPLGASLLGRLSGLLHGVVDRLALACRVRRWFSYDGFLGSGEFGHGDDVRSGDRAVIWRERRQAKFPFVVGHSRRWAWSPWSEERQTRAGDGKVAIGDRSADGIRGRTVRSTRAA